MCVEGTDDVANEDAPGAVAGLTGLGLAAIAPSSALAETARLGVDITDSADPATTGQELVYTVTVSNAGPDIATEARLVDTLSPKLDFISAVPSQGTWSGRTRGTSAASSGRSSAAGRRRS